MCGHSKCPSIMGTWRDKPPTCQHNKAAAVAVSVHTRLLQLQSPFTQESNSHGQLIQMLSAIPMSLWHKVLVEAADTTNMYTASAQRAATLCVSQLHTVQTNSTQHNVYSLHNGPRWLNDQSKAPLCATAMITTLSMTTLPSYNTNQLLPFEGDVLDTSWLYVYVPTVSAHCMWPP